MEAYCVKCRAKKEMKDAKVITMKNKKLATQGVCPTCGTKMFRIGITHIIETSPTQNPQLAPPTPTPPLAL